jgi:hypothetical protein
MKKWCLVHWEEDLFKKNCIGWEKRLCVFPRRCFYSGKYLWFNQSYFGVSMLTGPGEPVFDYRWCHLDHFLFLKIRGTI